MISTSIMLDFISKAQTPLETGKAKSSGENNSYPAFKDILSNTTKQSSFNTGIARDRSNRSSLQENDTNDTAPKANIRCFRQLSRLDKGNAPSKEVKPKNDKPESRDNAQEEENISLEADILMNCISQVLGIQPHEFAKLLASADINPEDLIDSTKASEIVTKISDLAGLTPEQGEALKEMIQMTSANIQQVLTAANNDDLQKLSMTDEAVVQPENSSITQGKDEINLTKMQSDTSEGNENSAMLSELAAKIKTKLDEVAELLEQNPQDLNAQILKGIHTAIPKVQDINPLQAILNEMDVAKKEVSHREEQSEQTTTGEEEILKVEVKPLPTGASTLKASIEQDDKNHDFTGYMNKELKTEVKNDQPSPEGFKIDVNMVNANQTPKTENVEATLKPQKEVQVSKGEILQQVVEKAKVVIDSSKSEMIMELKPESLGKLSLKIVTERGIVTARFVAESQQVKEVLESNMQLLKDSLEKQGLSVQGLSVSVGQDSSDDLYRQRNYAAFQERMAGKTEKQSGDMMVSMNETLQMRQTINPYGRSESKINLTA